MPVESSERKLANVYVPDEVPEEVVGLVLCAGVIEIPATSCSNLFCIVWMTDRIWVNWPRMTWISASKLVFVAGDVVAVGVVTGWGVTVAVALVTVTGSVLHPPDEAHTEMDEVPGFVPESVSTAPFMVACTTFEFELFDTKYPEFPEIVIVAFCPTAMVGFVVLKTTAEFVPDVPDEPEDEPTFAVMVPQPLGNAQMEIVAEPLPMPEIVTTLPFTAGKATLGLELLET